MRKELRIKARNTRREFDARVDALPRCKIVQRLVVKRLWVAGRASEDREEWMEEVRAHCEKMLPRQRRDLGKCSRRGFKNNGAEETVLQLGVARRSLSLSTEFFEPLRIMMKNKANGPVYEVTHWLEMRFRGECRAPAAWKILRFLQSSKVALQCGTSRNRNRRAC